MSKSGTLEVTLPSEREIRVKRVFEAPCSRVFDAFTRPALVKRWNFGPDGWSLAVCEMDLVVGGAIRFVWQHTDGRKMGVSGVLRDVTPPHRLVHTELFDEDWTGVETQVTTELAEASGRTTLTLTIRYASQKSRDEARSFNMEAGMSRGYERLADVLATTGA